MLVTGVCGVVPPCVLSLLPFSIRLSDMPALLGGTAYLKIFAESVSPMLYNSERRTKRFRPLGKPATEGPLVR